MNSKLIIVNYIYIQTMTNYSQNRSHHNNDKFEF